MTHATHGGQQGNEAGGEAEKDAGGSAAEHASAATAAAAPGGWQCPAMTLGGHGGASETERGGVEYPNRAGEGGGAGPATEQRQSAGGRTKRSTAGALSPEGTAGPTVTSHRRGAAGGQRGGRREAEAVSRLDGAQPRASSEAGSDQAPRCINAAAAPRLTSRAAQRAGTAEPA